MGMIKCEECGQMVSDQARSCPHCGASLKTDTPLGPQQTIYVNTTEHHSNGLGTAGLILAIFGLFVGWVPVLGWIIWTLGVLFSIIGLFKTPRSCAIAGCIISFIGLIFLITLAATIAAIFGLS
ncbi:MAG: zinc ribbon domain-containing protein [Porphyromonadaceae bacterium]|nr:zinc ribbon domain-containing protein [Porphyromonadaceae bacterium]